MPQSPPKYASACRWAGYHNFQYVTVWMTTYIDSKLGIFFEIFAPNKTEERENVIDT